MKTLEKSNSKQARVRILERRHARLFFVRVSRTLLISISFSIDLQCRQRPYSCRYSPLTNLTSGTPASRKYSRQYLFFFFVYVSFLPEIMLSCCRTRRSHIWNQHRQRAEGLPNHCIFDRIDRIEYATRSRFLEAIHGDVNAASDNGGPA